MKKRVAFYLRVSSERQDYERQRHELEEYARVRDFDVKFVFSEKISGYSDERTEFKKLASLTKSDIDIILCWELSRLGRHMSSIIKFMEDKAKEQINIITLKENLVLLDENCNITPSTLLILSIGSAFAEIERQKIKERTTSGRRNKILQGLSIYSGKLPLGYKYDKNKQLDIDEGGAEKVKNIYKLYLNGNSLIDVSKIMKMPVTNIRKILVNTCYIGYVYRKSIDKNVETPQIIKKTDFELVQERLKDNKLNSHKPLTLNVLSGKVHCSVCGKIMSRSNDKWRCHGYHTSITIKATEQANALVMKRLKDEIGFEKIKSEQEESVKKLLQKAADTSELVYGLEDKIDEMKQKLEVLKDVFTVDQLKKEIADIKKVESERDKNQKIIDRLLMNANEIEKNIDEMKCDESIIDKVDVEKVGSFEKILTYTAAGKKIKILVNSKKKYFCYI